MRQSTRQLDARPMRLALGGLLVSWLLVGGELRGREPWEQDFVCHEIAPLPAVQPVAHEEVDAAEPPSWESYAPQSAAPPATIIEPPFPANQLSPFEPAAANEVPCFECEPDDRPRPEGILPFVDAMPPEWDWGVDGLARGYWLNDQRIEWTGLESTLGAEGSIAPSIRRQCGDWEFLAYGDFYLNQQFDRNILVDSAERRAYYANWDVEPFEISNLYVEATHGDFTFKLGKFETPFGRYYFPLMSNPRFDAPFIRTEAIDWRETGFLMHHQRGLFVADVAVTNGNPDLDTNSSKALVARVGLEGENFTAGCSVKTQDGVGSEWQKMHENHYGADAMVRFGKWTLSGEFIYDEYGFRRPRLTQDDIFWGRSIYHRDLVRPSGNPLSSLGYYVDLGYQGERWYFGLNYGVNDPDSIGDPIHDQTIERGMVKAVHSITPGFDFFAVFLLESGGFPAQNARNRTGDLTYLGFQATF